MKKLFTLIAILCALLSTATAQINKAQADNIVLERLEKETRAYTLFATNGVQNNFTIRTDNGEELELNLCWVYYVKYTANITGVYIAVNKSNGNVLEVRPSSNAVPKDIEKWRVVKKEDNVSFTPCKKNETKGGNEFSDKVDVEFTNNGVEITHRDFEVACDFTTVNVTHTFVNGVLNITQQGTPNQAKCRCHTDVSYTIGGISQDAVNAIFINGELVYGNDGSSVGNFYDVDYRIGLWVNPDGQDTLVFVDSSELIRKGIPYKYEEYLYRIENNTLIINGSTCHSILKAEKDTVVIGNMYITTGFGDNSGTFIKVKKENEEGYVTFGANYHTVNCISTVTMFLDGENIGTLQNPADAISECGEEKNLTKKILVGEHSYRVEIRGCFTKDITGTFVVSENECKKIFIDYYKIFGNQSNCDPNVIIDEEEYFKVPELRGGISNMRIEDNNLKFTITASGCDGSSWVAKLITTGAIEKSNPPQRTVQLSFENGEACRAIVSKEFSFNIECLQVKGYNKVWLKIAGNSILYEYGEYFKATVLGKGQDCGNTFLIRFDEEVAGLPNSPVKGCYYADNLPEEYKIEGKTVEIQFRLPKEDEMSACTTMGIAFPHMYVLDVKDNCKIDLKIGDETEIKQGETACNPQNGLSLRVESVNDSRCPIGAVCAWAGTAAVQIHLTTGKGTYNFTLDTHSGTAFKSDTIIEGFRYKLVNVFPYPVVGEEQPIKTVHILVEKYNESNCDKDVIISQTEYENAPNHPLSIIDMKIVDNCLKIKFSASGCTGNNWVVKLIDAGMIAESLPCQRTLRLSLEHIGVCAAYFENEMSFNIEGLQIQRDHSVILHIAEKTILYEY